MKGNADCHIPNDKYRANYDQIFGKGVETPSDEDSSSTLQTPDPHEETGS